MGEGTAEQRGAEIVPWVNTLYPGATAAYATGSAVRHGLQNRP